MTLSGLLVELSRRGLLVESDGVSAVLRGGKADAELREALREHRPHLVRLFRAGGPTWRRRLAEVDADTREAWVLLSAGCEAAGHCPAVAEYLAGSLL